MPAEMQTEIPIEIPIEMPIESLCQTADNSFFAYDLDAMQSHVSRLQGERVRFWYATKANPLSAILNTLQSSGFGFDVASQGELEQVIRIGADPTKILLTGPGKTDAFLRKALESGVRTFVLESHSQVERLNGLLQEMNVRADALLRIQMEWDESAESVLGGNAVSAFGLDWKEWRKLKPSQHSHLDIQGFHNFQWGNIQDATQMLEIWQTIFRQMRAFANEWKISEIPVVDLGGGLGIPYDHSNISFDRSGVSFSWDSVRSTLEKMRDEYKVGEVWLELGRYAVGTFGKYCTKILDRKTVRGKELLIVDGGMNHLIRPSLVSEPFPTELIRTSTAAKKKFQIHGPLCTSLDTFGEVELPDDIQSGDWLVMHQAGAYGFSESMPFFLCHDIASEFVWRNGDWQEIRGKATAETWLR